MANVKPSGDAANTVELLPTLAQFDMCKPTHFAKAGWTLEAVRLRGQGGMFDKKEHYDEREVGVPLADGRSLTLPLKDRMYSLFRSVEVEGRDMPSFIKWTQKNLPFFSISVTSVVLVHKDTGDRVVCRIIGRATKNIMSKKFIAHTFNGAKMTEDNVDEVAALLDDLVYGYCSYEYSAGKRNVICDS